MKNDKIKIGLVGLGNRGMATLQRYSCIKGACFTAIYDIAEDKCIKAKEYLIAEENVSPKIEDWKTMCQDDNVDLIYICTNWDSHAEIALYAMSKGKDVAVEVPLATNVSDCNLLSQMSEDTGCRCMLLENCCYDVFHLGVLGIIKKGLLGEISHLEGAYIHYLAEDAVKGYKGNPYPTHAIGPISQIIPNDKIQTLVSVDGLNGINNTLIKTDKGRSILIQFDETTPRPYNRLQTICGSLGFIQKYPLPCVQIGDMLLQGKNAEDFVYNYISTDYRKLIDDGRSLGVKNLMNYIMDRRLIDTLLNDTDWDISIEHAVLWSSLSEFTAKSINKQSIISF